MLSRASLQRWACRSWAAAIRAPFPQQRGDNLPARIGNPEANKTIWCASLGNGDMLHPKDSIMRFSRSLTACLMVALMFPVGAVAIPAAPAEKSDAAWTAIRDVLGRQGKIDQGIL